MLTPQDIIEQIYKCEILLYTFKDVKCKKKSQIYKLEILLYTYKCHKNLFIWTVFY